MNQVKLVAIILIILLIINFILFILSYITPLAFWITTTIIAIAAYKGIPKLKEKLK